MKIIGLRLAGLKYLWAAGLAVVPVWSFATQSATLAWDPSPDSVVVGYRIYYGVASRSYTNVVDVSNSTNVTIPGLTEEVTYYFAATAYSSLGVESAFSAETLYSVPGNRGNRAPISKPITAITVNGNGATFFELGLESLVAGKTYTVTAIPSAGQEFVGWSGSYVSSNPQLTFLMGSNLVLQANFKASAFAPIAGTYSGLFAESDQVRLSRSGFFKISATAHGTYSGYVQLGAKRYALAGKLDEQGQSTKTILRRGDTPLALDLWIGSGSGSDQMFGQLTNETWSATLMGNRAVFNPKTNPATLYAGRFTMLIPGQEGDPSVPAGDGYGTVTVDSWGGARFAGILADGTRVSQSATLSKDGKWPLYSALYSGDGLIWSWASFANESASDFSAALNWIKTPDGKAHYYPGGFTNQCAAVGSVYTPPADSNMLGLSSAHLEFSGGNSSGFTNSLSLGAHSKVSSSENHLSMSFSLASGIYRGKVEDPGSGKPHVFGGAVLQKLNAGYGFLLGTDQTSEVVLAP